MGNRVSEQAEYSGTVASFTGTVDSSITNLTANIDPTQDLHGYAKPWPAGGGKNKLNNILTTWTLYNTTFTTQNDGSVIAVSTTPPTATTYADLVSSSFSLPEGTYILSGCPAGGGNSSYDLRIKITTNGTSQVKYDYGSGVEFTIQSGTVINYLRVAIRANYDASAGVTFYPMIRLASVADDSYEPYSNICPITGRTGLDVWDDPKYGGTIEWNQLLDGSADASWSVANSTKSFSDGVCTFTASAKDGYVQLNVTRTEKDHAYLAIVDIKTATATDRVALNWYGGEYKYCESTTNWQKVSAISKRSVSNNNFKMRIADRRTSGWDAVQVKNFMLFDLTAMFGSTIADYIYGLEQANTGAGVAWFRNLFPKDYYPYDNSYTATCVSAVNGDPYTKVSVEWTSQAGTVYGGTVDVVTGLLTVSKANIPSYNGETINEPWLSSMDAYAAGTTPTIGAQVVYTLATPLTYQLTPKQVATLVGQNNVWSSTGGTVNVTVYSALTGFHGWLIKVKQGNNLVEIPLTLIRAETYRSTPDQRMEWSAERDITGVLHRETVLNTPPKIEFNTPLLTNKEINALNTIIRNGFTNALSRDVTIQFYDNEKDEYWQWDCYMPDVEYTIRNVDIANNVINYEELRYAFIGY